MSLKILHNIQGLKGQITCNLLFMVFTGFSLTFIFPQTKIYDFYVPGDPSMEASTYVGYTAKVKLKNLTEYSTWKSKQFSEPD